MQTIFRGLFLLSALILPSAASAHGGHIGELAGHSHWIGVAALAGAAAIAAVVAAKSRKKDDKAETSEPDTVAEDEVEAAQ